MSIVLMSTEIDRMKETEREDKREVQMFGADTLEDFSYILLLLCDCNRIDNISTEAVCNELWKEDRGSPFV